MHAELASDLLRSAVLTALTLAAPVLLGVLAVALVVGLLQAMTQLHDQTLNLVPRLAVGGIVLLALLPWMIGRLVDFTTELYRGAGGGL